MLIFPTYEGRRTLAIMQPVETPQPSYSATCGNQAFPHPMYRAACKILLNRVFTKENTTSSLRESSSPFFLQEFRPLTPLKATYRFTSLTVIRVMKIMCNNQIHLSQNQVKAQSQLLNSTYHLQLLSLIQNQPIMHIATSSHELSQFPYNIWCTYPTKSTSHIP
jgi:hypothetical protein